MQKLLKWGSPSGFLRRKRDERWGHSLVMSVLTGFAAAGISMIVLLRFLQPRQSIPLYFVFIVIGVLITGTILGYWLQSVTGSMVVLYNEEIWLYGFSKSSSNSPIRLVFSNISECRFSREMGKKTEFTLMTLTFKNKTVFSARELRDIGEIGIPISIDRKQVEQILRTGGVKIIAE